MFWPVLDLFGPSGSEDPAEWSSHDPVTPWSAKIQGPDSKATVTEAQQRWAGSRPCFVIVCTIKTTDVLFFLAFPTLTRQNTQPFGGAQNLPSGYLT